MRLILAKHASYGRELVCGSAKEAKKLLNEKVINDLMIAYTLTGRETGLDLLNWASSKNRLPERITIIERNHRATLVMAEFLASKGYRSLDSRKFIKNNAL